MDKLLTAVNTTLSIVTTLALVWLYMSINDLSTHVYQLQQSAVNMGVDEEP